MKKAFVKTENYARFAAGVKAVEQRGAAEAGMMLVHGQPGYGKSHIVYRWAEEAGAVYLRANVDWTPKYFLVELCKALNIDGRGTAQALFERCLRVLASPCPVYGGPWGQDICAGRRATPMPTSNPYALRQWRECRHCPNFTEETTC